MNTGALFFQSALINAAIFLWIACSLSTMRILVACDCKVSTALFFSVFFGPIAFVGAWLYEAQFTKTNADRRLSPRAVGNLRSWIGMTVVITGISSLFYALFVANYYTTNTSNELLLRNIIIFVFLAGVLGGMLLSAFALRVAFFESAWVSFVLASFMLLLSDWSEEVFSYGTSAAFFVTLMLTSTTLLVISLNLGGAFGYLLFGEGGANFRFGYESFIGRRFLMTKRSSHVVSLITVISVIAVTIACAGMIVVMSVMNGFSSDLRTKILGANAHLMVLKYGKDFTEYDKIIEKTRDIPGVISADAFVVNEGMVHSNKNIATAIITGVDLAHVRESGRLKYVSEQALSFLRDPEKIPVITELKPGTDIASVDDAEAAKNDLPGVVIGKEMASDLQVLIGDTVNLVSPIGDIGPTGPIPRAKAFRVAGFFYSGMYEYDVKFAFIKLSDAQDFFNLEGSVSGIEYRVDNIESTRKIAKEIESVIGGYPYYARDWMQMNRNMFSALQLEKIAMLIILGTYILLASLLILVTLITVVMEKGKEIAILKSMGATDVSIMKIFVTYGLFIGAIGAAVGGTLGLIMCLLIEKIGIKVDPDVYYFSNLPVKIVMGEVVLVVLAAILISFLATIPPSLFAARLKPVDGLRYE
ncbi:MAG TPA: FtsX-like permease family protein [Myxococcota bacterium]|nr:FtsX-like permease family protein [Myxococcota bacterium]